MPHVTILGAGAAGLITGWHLKQHNLDFTILEKQSYAGGLARSFEWHGFNCDFAAHRLFTSDENILQQLLRLVPMGRQIRRSRIYLRGHWMRDPLDVIELAQKLSIPEGLSILLSFLFRPRNLVDTNFQNFVLRRYGRSLYRFFFQPYTEKLFGIPGEEISVLWAQQKVRLANPLDNLRENTKTKFQYFYYPIRGGYGAIVDRLYKEVKDHVLLDAAVTGINGSGGSLSEVHYRKEGEQHTLYTQAVISTLPLTLTTRMLGQSFNFKFQKVDAVYLLVDRPFVSDYHWIYFIDQDMSINRLVEFKNMSPIDLPVDRTVLCAEVTQQHADPAARVVSDLQRIGLLREGEILDTKTLREEFAYPVYNLDYDIRLGEAGEYLSQFKNLYTVGRAAEFKHREVDDVFSSASQTVGEIVRRFSSVSLPKPREEIKVLQPNGRKVFAVILTYNHFADTQECLKSLDDTAFEGLEVVVVDNGSTDGTPEDIRRDFPHVHVIENGENLGVPAGYNVGFDYALQQGADYILMLNNDTVLAPDMLQLLIDQAETDPQAGIIMPRVLVHGSDGQVWSSGGRYRRFPPAILMTEKRLRQERTPVRLIEYAPSCGLLIHRRAFERAGLFDPGYFFLFDDWDFSERVRAHGLHIWFVREARLWHKVSRTTQGPRSASFWYTMGASMARFYRRHGRPVWLSLTIHIGYYILREFVWKRNWSYWPDYRRGIRDGLQKPLGNLPQIQ